MPCVFAVACRHCHRIGPGRFGVDGLRRGDGLGERVGRSGDGVTAGARDPRAGEEEGSVKYGDGCCHLRKMTASCRLASLIPRDIFLNGGIWESVQRPPTSTSVLCPHSLYISQLE